MYEHYPPPRIPTAPQQCPCSSEFGFFKNQKTQCKCCQRYYCIDCLNQQRCVLCNYHFNGKCIGILLTYCESADPKEVNAALLSLLTIHTKTAIPPTVLKKSGFHIPIISALHHSDCVFNALNLLVALRKRIRIPFTQEELIQIAKIGLMTTDNKLDGLCLYLIISFSIQELPLPNTLDELLKMKSTPTTSFFTSYILYYTLHIYKAHPSFARYIFSNLLYKECNFSTLLLYDLAQLLPEPTILSFFTTLSNHREYRHQLLQSNILFKLPSTADSIQIVINLIDEPHLSFFTPHFPFLCDLLVDSHADTATLSTCCSIFFETPSRMQFVQIIKESEALPKLLRSVIPEKVGLGLDVISITKDIELLPLVVSVVEIEEIRGKWLKAMVELGGISKDMSQCIPIVIECIKKGNDLATALQLAAASETILEIVEGCADVLVGLLLTDKRREAAMVIQQVISHKGKGILLQHSLLINIAESIETECNVEVLKVLPLIIHDLPKTVLLQRIIHKIVGVYLLQQKFTKVCLEVLVLISQDQAILSIVNSVRINKLNDFLQFLVLRANSAPEDMKWCYLEMLNIFITNSYTKELISYSVAGVVNDIFIKSNDIQAITYSIQCLQSLIILPKTCGSVLYRHLEQRLLVLLHTIYSLTTPLQNVLFEKILQFIYTITTLHPQQLPAYLSFVKYIPFSRIPQTSVDYSLNLLLQLTTIDPSVTALIFPSLKNIATTNPQTLAKLIYISLSLVPLESVIKYFTPDVLTLYIKSNDNDLITHALNCILLITPPISLIVDIFQLLTDTLSDDLKDLILKVLTKVLPNILIEDLLPYLKSIFPFMINKHATYLLPLFSIMLTSTPTTFSSMIITTELRNKLTHSKDLASFISLALTLNPIVLLPYFLPLLRSLLTSTPAFTSVVHSALTQLLSQSTDVVNDTTFITSLASLLIDDHLVNRCQKQFQILLNHDCFVQAFLKVKGIKVLKQFYISNILRIEITQAIGRNVSIEASELLPLIINEATNGCVDSLTTVIQFASQRIGKEIIVESINEFIKLRTTNRQELELVSILGEVEINFTWIEEQIKERKTLTEEQLYWLLRIIGNFIIKGFILDEIILSELFNTTNVKILTELLSIILLLPQKYIPLIPSDFLDHCFSFNDPLVNQYVHDIYAFLE
ncbi:WW domain-containing protein [Entamoeba marina]